ncbi:MAG TPA: hypothetical protein VF520_16455 [Thermoleophilaceae bacterium]|jgi:hypothetical protein
MSRRAAITVNRPRAEVERLWQDGDYAATFKDAPGDRGTEIHLELDDASAVGEVVGKLTGSDPLSEAKDRLRRFKQRVETGEVARSDGTPEGEAAARKLKQRPAQPLDGAGAEKAGV